MGVMDPNTQITCSPKYDLKYYVGGILVHKFLKGNDYDFIFIDFVESYVDSEGNLHNCKEDEDRPIRVKSLNHAEFLILQPSLFNIKL